MRNQVVSKALTRPALREIRRRDPHGPLTVALPFLTHRHTPSIGTEIDSGDRSNSRLSPRAASRGSAPLLQPGRRIRRAPVNRPNPDVRRPTRDEADKARCLTGLHALCSVSSVLGGRDRLIDTTLRGATLRSHASAFFIVNMCLASDRGPGGGAISGAIVTFHLGERGRPTAVFERRDRRWVIVHLHASSALPIQ